MTYSNVARIGGATSVYIVSAPDSSPEPTWFGLPRRIVALSTAAALAAALVAGLITSALIGGDDDSSDGGENPSLTLEPIDGVPDVVGAPLALSYETFEGDISNTGTYVGEPLVVNFFASWCPPCVAEMPDFEAVYQEVGDQVAFLGLSSIESVDDALDLIDRTGITYDVGRDPQGDAFADVGGLNMPTTVFIDSAGTVVEVHTGALTADQLRTRIEEKLLS